MRRTVPFLAFAAALASTPALALDCADPQTQADMNACAGQRYEEADAALNAAYREIMGELAGNEEMQGLLRDAQRAWIAFRDAQCEFRTANSRNGSIHPTLLAGCLADVTDKRTQELRNALDCPEGDLTCPAP